ncbi:MAG: methyltransferase domain-containing protein [Proteobacteria bacterium]|nr:methyltransferase domain-containing protein [Pseudomonadota bacterium]
MRKNQPDHVLSIGRNGLDRKRRRKLEFFQAILSGQSEYSTSRTIEQYNKMLFPDKNWRDKKSLLEYLDRLNAENVSTIIDIGVGFPSPYNLPNTTRRYKQGNIACFGLDPRFSQYSKGFSRRTIVSENINTFKNHFLQLLRREPLFLIHPEQKNYVAGFVQHLPFADQSADLIVSSFCLPYWIWNENELLAAFHECTRVIKENKELRLFPLFSKDEIFFTDKTKFGQFVSRYYEFVFIENNKIYKNDPLRSSGATMILKRNSEIYRREELYE